MPWYYPSILKRKDRSPFPDRPAHYTLSVPPSPPPLFYFPRYSPDSHHTSYAEYSPRRSTLSPKSSLRRSSSAQDRNSWPKRVSFSDETSFTPLSKKSRAKMIPRLRREKRHIPRNAAQSFDYDAAPNGLFPHSVDNNGYPTPPSHPGVPLAANARVSAGTFGARFSNHGLPTPPLSRTRNGFGSFRERSKSSSRQARHSLDSISSLDLASTKKLKPALKSAAFAIGHDVLAKASKKDREPRGKKHKEAQRRSHEAKSDSDGDDHHSQRRHRRHRHHRHRHDSPRRRRSVSSSGHERDDRHRGYSSSGDQRRRRSRHREGHDDSGILLKRRSYSHSPRRYTHDAHTQTDISGDIARSRRLSSRHASPSDQWAALFTGSQSKTKSSDKERSQRRREQRRASREFDRQEGQTFSDASRFLKDEDEEEERARRRRRRRERLRDGNPMYGNRTFWVMEDDEAGHRVADLSRSRRRH